MVVDPALLPVTAGTWRAVLVAPAGMVIVEGNTDAIKGLVLANVRYTVPVGAVPSDTGKLTVLPGVTVTLEGNRMPPLDGCVTVTLAVALARLVALAVMVTDPAVTPVTGTVTLVALAPMLTVAGVEATAALLELRLTDSPPAGAGADRFRVRFWVSAPPIVRLPGQKLMVVAEVPPDETSNCVLAVAYPGPVALMVTDPALLPVTVGVERGAFMPAGTKKLAGDTVAVVGLLLVSAIETPPSGAAVPNVTGKFTVSPGATVTLAGRMIPAVWKVH